MKDLFLPECLTAGCVAADGRRLAAPLDGEGARQAGFVPAPGFFTRFFLAGECVSTFDLAWELAGREDLPEWSAVLALSQTSGRGQVRRVWVSPPGNLYVSFFLPFGFARLGDLASLTAGFCIQQALAEMGIDTRLKWPNDLLLQEEGVEKGKFGGLLLEERQGRLLAGLGLNLRSAPGNDAMRPGRAVVAAALTPGLDSEQGPVFPFWLRLAAGMRQSWETRLAGADAQAVCRTIESVLAWRDCPVQADEGRVRGMITGLAPDGALLLHTKRGLATLDSGSIFPCEERGIPL